MGSYAQDPLRQWLEAQILIYEGKAEETRKGNIEHSAQKGRNKRAHGRSDAMILFPKSLGGSNWPQPIVSLRNSGKKTGLWGCSSFIRLL